MDVRHARRIKADRPRTGDEGFLGQHVEIGHVWAADKRIAERPDFKYRRTLRDECCKAGAIDETVGRASSFTPVVLIVVQQFGVPQVSEIHV